MQERLGHARITTTLNLYGHILPSTEEALVDALDAIYDGAAAAASATVQPLRPAGAEG